MFRRWCLIPVIVSVALATQAEAGSEKPLLQQWVKEQQSGCAPEKTVFKQGHVTRRDVNGDGIEDFILDTAFVECGNGMRAFCGSGGCDLTVIASIGGDFVQAFSGLVRGVTYTAVGGRPAMVLTTHGSGCGKVGAQDCKKTLFWNGRAFSSRR